MTNDKIQMTKEIPAAPFVISDLDFAIPWSLVGHWWVIRHSLKGVTMSAAITSLGKLVVASDTAFSTNLLRLDFHDFDHGVTLELKDCNSTRGKLDRDDARVRQSRTVVAPRIRCQPTAVELAAILAWATGGTPSGSGTVTYPLANTAAARSLWYLPSNGTGWQLQNCAVDSMTIRGSSGEPLDVELALIAQTFARTSSSYPATSLDISSQPFIFSDLALTFGGTATQVREFSMSLRNGIDRSRFLNSLTLTALNKLHRTITWSLDMPAGDYDANWNDALSAGVTSVATFTGPGTQVLSITSNAVRYVPRNPNVPFHAESFLRLEGEAYSADGTSDPLSITLHE